MAELSIIVPAYRVQGYLRECLDSILDQPFRDLEVIGVDDRSPDGSGAILAEYAARDPRVRVVSLERNVGLGPARNIGLDHATGGYVWFLDSDDWLAPGSLRAVARRLRDTRPDVLLLNHAKAHWDPRIRPVPHSAVLSQAPEVFTLREWLPAIDVLHVAWNKVVRREFLVGLGLRFAPGWYEDVSFTYPLLLAAERISTLDRVCVNYRQRRVGAITGTTGEGHFDMFDHWELVFAELDKTRPDAAGGTTGPAGAGGGTAGAGGGTGGPAGADRPDVAELRPHLFARMIWHYLMVLGNQSRVPPELRRRFFARVVEHYRRYLPPGGYPRPGGVAGVRHTLVARDAYRSYEALRSGYRAAVRARRLAGRVRHGLRGRLRGAARRGREALLRGYYRVQLRLPLEESLAVFGAYWYRGYSCNPAAIYEKARELAPGVRGVWVVHRNRVASLPPGVPYVVAGTRAYYRALARARWLVNNVNFPDFVVKRAGSTHVMTHHGTPLKVMGIDEHRYPGRLIQDALKTGPRRADEIGALLHRCDRWDYSVAQNAFTTQVWDRAYPCRYEHLTVGYPRNDRLANATAADVAAARERLGLAPGRIAVMYAPTHREYHTGYRPPLDVEDLADDLGPEYVVLSRAHYFYVRPGGRPSGGAGPGGAGPGGAGPDGARARVVDVSGYPVVEDLYLAADVVITDYSSLMFDVAVLDRPIVLYTPDWQVYRTIRGVTFDVLATPPGAVATSYPRLVELFTSGAYRDDAATAARAAFRARFCALEDGRAAERVVRKIFPVAAAGGPTSGLG